MGKGIDPNPHPLDVAILALWGTKLFLTNPLKGGQIQDRIFRFVNYMTPVAGPDTAFTASQISGWSRMPLRQVERALERLKKNRKVQRAKVAGQFWYSIPGRMPKEFLMVRSNPDMIDMALLGLQTFKTFQPGPKSNPLPNAQGDAPGKHKAWYVMWPGATYAEGPYRFSRPKSARQVRDMLRRQERKYGGKGLPRGVQVWPAGEGPAIYKNPDIEENPRSSVWKTHKAGPAQARQKIRTFAGQEYGGPNYSKQFYKDEGCVACAVDGHGHGGIFVGVWNRKKCKLKIREDMMYTYWGYEGQDPAFAIYVFEEDVNWAHFYLDNPTVAKKCVAKGWPSLKGKALTAKWRENLIAAEKTIKAYPKGPSSYVSNPHSPSINPRKSKMKLPQYIAQWVKREFAPQYHAQVTQGLIDVAAGNRPGNQFERDAISRIMKSYNKKKRGKKKARKKNPKLGIRKHKLLTKAIEKKLPALYATENVPLEQKVAVVKFFTPDSNWTWYGLEYDPKTRTFFGWVVGHEKELGYFSLDELESARGPMGLPIERDKWFSPTPLGQLMKQS